MDDELLDLYRQWQAALTKWADTWVAGDLFYKMCNRVEASPHLDLQGFETTMERLHREAFPDARPVRLTAGDLADPRED